MTAASRILIIDYGSQFTQLIARRVREARVYSEIHPPTRSLEWIRDVEADRHHPQRRAELGLRRGRADRAIRALLDVAPVLGVCYGMQLIAHLRGRRGHRAAAGASTAAPRSRSTEPSGAVRRLRPAARRRTVWMSHGDHVESAAAGLPRHRRAARATRRRRSRIESKPIYGVQFHPEVAHTPRGAELHRELPVRRLRLRRRAGRRARSSTTRSRRSARWSATRRSSAGCPAASIRRVAAALVHRAIGDQLTCIFVDTGLLRLHEREQVERTLRAHLGIKLVTVDASRAVPDALRGVDDPEAEAQDHRRTRSSTCSRKRRPSAGTNAKFLVQGTLYPDVIESVIADRRPVGDDQDAPQRRRAQAGT